MCACDLQAETRFTPASDISLDSATSSSHLSSRLFLLSVNFATLFLAGFLSSFGFHSHLFFTSDTQAISDYSSILTQTPALALFILPSNSLYNGTDTAKGILKHVKEVAPSQKKEHVSVLHFVSFALDNLDLYVFIYIWRAVGFKATGSRKS